MLDWLKQILGEQYSPKIDQAVSAELDKQYAPRSELAAAVQQLETSAGCFKAMEQAMRQEMEDMRLDFDNQLRLTRLDSAVDRALADAGAINSAVVLPLLEDFIQSAQFDGNGQVAGLDQAIAQLKSDSKTAFLFFPDGGVRVSGVAPGSGSGDAPEHPKHEQLSVQFADALRQGDTLTAIHIKRQAAKDGMMI